MRGLSIWILPAIFITTVARAGPAPVVDREPVAEPAPVAGRAPIETAFRLMYELRFDDARREIARYRETHPDDPLGAAAEAASHLFEEFDRDGVLTSEFFLDDDRILGGVEGPTDPRRGAAFLAANERARASARRHMNANPDDADGLFVLTLADGMEGDFQAIIRKRQLSGLMLIHRAEKEAMRLLAVRADVADAYVALGSANYIIGCLPGYKRFLLWFGGVRGDRQRGMEQLEMAATHGHYLRPLAKAFLALASEREGQLDRARALFEELAREFPANRMFARELAKARKGSAPAGTPTPHERP